MYVSLPALSSYAWTDSNPLLLLADSGGNSTLVWNADCDPANTTRVLAMRVAVMNPGENDPVEVEQFLAGSSTMGPKDGPVKVGQGMTGGRSLTAVLRVPCPVASCCLLCCRLLWCRVEVEKLLAGSSTMGQRMGLSR